jgi:hypothetical protein
LGETLRGGGAGKVKGGKEERRTLKEGKRKKGRKGQSDRYLSSYLNT